MKPKLRYILRETTGANWPGILPYRHEGSRYGYSTRETAEDRARLIVTRYAARYGQGGPSFVVVPHPRYTRAIA